VLWGSVDAKGRRSVNSAVDGIGCRAVNSDDVAYSQFARLWRKPWQSDGGGLGAANHHKYLISLPRSKMFFRPGYVVWNRATKMRLKRHKLGMRFLPIRRLLVTSC
jgi:hypothetical protein